MFSEWIKVQKVVFLYLRSFETFGRNSKFQNMWSHLDCNHLVNDMFWFLQYSVMSIMVKLFSKSSQNKSLFLPRLRPYQMKNNDVRNKPAYYDLVSINLGLTFESRGTSKYVTTHKFLGIFPHPKKLHFYLILNYPRGISLQKVFQFVTFVR